MSTPFSLAFSADAEGVYGPQPLTVSVIVPSEDEFGTVDTLVVTASRGFKVACPERSNAYASPGLGTFRTRCNVDFGEQARGVFWVRVTDLPQPGSPVAGKVALNAVRDGRSIGFHQVSASAVANTPESVVSNFEGWYRGVASLEGLTIVDMESLENEIMQGDNSDPANMLDVPVDVYVWDSDSGLVPMTSLPPADLRSLKALVIDPTHTLAEGGLLYLDLGPPWPESTSPVPGPWGGTQPLFLGPDPSPSFVVDLGQMPSAIAPASIGTHTSNDLIFQGSRFVQANLMDGTITAIVPLSIRPLGTDHIRSSLVWSLSLSRASGGSAPALPTTNETCSGGCVGGPPPLGFSATDVPEWIRVGADLFGVRQLGYSSPGADAKLWWRKFLEVGTGFAPHWAHEAAMWSCLNSNRAIQPAVSSGTPSPRLADIYLSEFHDQFLWFDTVVDALLDIGEQEDGKLSSESTFLYSLTGEQRRTVRVRLFWNDGHLTSFRRGFEPRSASPGGFSSAYLEA